MYSSMYSWKMAIKQLCFVHVLHLLDHVCVFVSVNVFLFVCLCIATTFLVVASVHKLSVGAANAAGRQHGNRSAPSRWSL